MRPCPGCAAPQPPGVFGLCARCAATEVPAAATALGRGPRPRRRPGRVIRVIGRTRTQAEAALAEALEYPDVLERHAIEGYAGLMDVADVEEARDAWLAADPRVREAVRSSVLASLRRRAGVPP